MRWRCFLSAKLLNGILFFRIAGTLSVTYYSKVLQLIFVTIGNVSHTPPPILGICLRTKVLYQETDCVSFIWWSRATNLLVK